MNERETELVSAWIDGEAPENALDALGPEAETRAREFLALSAALRALPAPAPHEGFDSEVCASIAFSARRRRAARLVAWSGTLAAAAGIAIVLGVLNVQTPPPGAQEAAGLPDALHTQEEVLAAEVELATLPDADLLLFGEGEVLVPEFEVDEFAELLAAALPEDAEDAADFGAEADWYTDVQALDPEEAQTLALLLQDYAGEDLI